MGDQTSVVATAVLLERTRIRELYAGVRRADGSIDESQLARFEVALGVTS